MRMVLIFLSAYPELMALPLEKSRFKHVSFDDIPATNYVFETDTLRADVKSSSSALATALAPPKTVKEVSFEWLSEGTLKVTSAAHESKKSGDDARLRIGLLLKGPKPTFSFMAPRWLKEIGSLLKYSTNRMLYLIVGSQHTPGKRWESPYTSSIKSVSLASQPSDKEWKRATYKAPKPLNVVGIWIMADGDDTKSHFTTRLRHLKF